MSAALARDRASLITGGVLVVVALGAWAALFAEPDAAMRGPNGPDFLPFLGAWGVMMAAMMLPSATPMIALYAAVRRSATPTGMVGVSVAVFALVYVAIWLAFGVPVYLASMFLGSQTALGDMLPYALAGILVLAGVYQFTPLKRACLRVCRNPLSFLIARSRVGYRGTLGLAVEHALYCVGCCWALMIILVAVGAMALHWVLLIAAVVFIEKLLPRGEWTARVLGGTLVLIGLAVAVYPDLAMTLRPSMGTMGM